MKKLFFALMSIVTMSAFAQIEVTSPDGNVGIGTAYPFAKLDTKGTIRISNANGSNPFMAGSLDFIESGTVWGTNAYGFRFFHHGIENSLIFQSNATTTVTDIMTLTRGGYVGIGTTSPSEKLDVDGSIKASGNIIGNKYYIGEDVVIETDQNYVRFAVDPDLPGTIYTNKSMRFLGDVFSHTNLGSDLGLSVKRWNTIYGDKIDLSGNAIIDGNVGIGTTTPNEKLEVNGAVSIGNGSGYSNLLFEPVVGALGYEGIFEIKSKTVPGSGIAEYLTHFKTNTNSGPGTGETRHDVAIDGRVGIGTTDTFGHKLAVNGEATFNGAVDATDFNVFLPTLGGIVSPWPDYVFEKDYKLLSLKEVEEHIKEKGHLPNIPSAKEVEKKGSFSLGEMNKKLLEKIEELTLYTIQQEKEIKNLKNQEERIKKIEEENKKLKSLLERVAELEKSIKK